MQDKRPRNEKWRPHGNWEMYYPNGTLFSIRNYIDGERYGYWVYDYWIVDFTNKEYYAR